MISFVFVHHLAVFPCLEIIQPFGVVASSRCSTSPAGSCAEHWDGVVPWFDTNVSNGVLEAISSLVQAAKRRRAATGGRGLVSRWLRRRPGGRPNYRPKSGACRLLCRLNPTETANTLIQTEFSNNSKESGRKQLLVWNSTVKDGEAK